MCEVSIPISREKKNECKTRLVFRTLMHTIYVLINFSVSLYGGYISFTLPKDVAEIPLIKDMRNFLLFFLTNWNYLFQTVFLSFSLLYDVLEWLDKHQTDIGKKLMYYRDVMFSGMVVPFTLFISTMFWTVYFIDRELVFPVVYDQVVPWWFNHCVHTNITVMLLVETLLQSRRYPTDKKLELGLIGGIGVLYAIVYYSIYFITGRWLYAVFGIMSWWQICIYQLCIWGSTFVFYYLHFPINRIFHREPVEEKLQTRFDRDEWTLKNEKGQVENSHL